MRAWYPQYESQCWYTNTYLVTEPRQIRKAAKSDREWNNVEESGCNFTCLAMMVGLNPGYFASLAAKNGLFSFDRDPELRFVWDINCPLKNGPVKHLRLRRVWHPIKRKTVNIYLKHTGTEYVASKEKVPSLQDRLAAARRIIKSAHSRGQHVIAGFDDHSRLVAGTSGTDFFLWDPDLTETPIQANLRGKLTLPWFFRTYDQDRDFDKKRAEILSYEVAIT